MREKKSLNLMALLTLALFLAGSLLLATPTSTYACHAEKAQAAVKKVEEKVKAKKAAVVKKVKKEHKKSNVVTKADFTGTWKTNLGNYTLEQNGNQVTGSSANGKVSITGRVTGKVLKGTWSRTVADDSKVKTGEFTLHIDNNNKCFWGKWRSGSHGNWINIAGTKVKAETSPEITYDWDGTFSTSWGTMTLTKKGNSITGTFTQSSGKIKGTVSGNTLTGTWSMAPTYTAPDDAGDIVITMSKDGKTLTAKWRYGSTGDWNTNWQGTRIEQALSTWSGVWSTSWGDMTLVQTGDEVTGSYTYQNGTLEGTVSGSVLIGTWVIDDSPGAVNGSGELVLTLAADGKSFTGKWRYGTSGDWYQGLNGNRK